MDSSKISALVVVAVVVLTVATRGVEGQTPSCASKLVPCASYLNSTGTPPASCCDPLKEAITQELTCLCTLYNTPGLLQSFGINLTQALLLPGRCNLSGDLNACSKALAPVSPSSVPPPATPGKDSNGVGRIAWTGIPGVLLFWASIMLY